MEAIGDPTGYRARWVVHASEVGFLPYELVDPAPDESSEAGLGSGTHQLSMSITHRIGDSYLTVDTEMRRDGVHEAVPVRHTVLNTLYEMTPDPLTLPFRLTASFEERTLTIDVDGVAVKFAGVAAVEAGTWEVRGWVGPDTEISLRGSGELAPTALRRRTDLKVEPLPVTE